MSENLKKKLLNGFADDNISQLLDEIEGVSPLEFVLRIQSKKDLPLSLRMEAAKIAMPYMHKKQPLDMNHASTIEIIPPFVPSKSDLIEYEDLTDVVEIDSED